ncbi:ribosomal protein L40E [Nocardiopsis mwathae]|uniref:Ribosomal protein L40E n=1 Tax=Nocardiopsis mwathae TaxID=1472723 RepID=A0A7W9YGZ1_9ACTN|nr:zinc ribbon domain-containing protein [Nocardiopsis mwathae]MBB6171942.1 ribosomal protein L40E [Nocardiopsis mwathae]
MEGRPDPHYILTVPPEVRPVILGDLEWLATKVYQEEAPLLDMLAVKLRSGGGEMRLTQREAQLITAPVLWGVHRDAYANYMEEFEAVRSKHRRPRICGGCGAENPDYNQYCVSCGRKL